MEIMAVGLLAVALIAALNVVAPRLGVAPQIILVVAGAGMSFLPGADRMTLKPEVVMMGLLPLVLFASSLALPTIEFRRDLAAIGGLSVVLVIDTAVALGWVIHLIVPGMPLAIGIALGALISPTDAAATGIVKRLGLSPRVLAILDGESLLNDASALVMMRASLAALATGFSLFGIARDFVWAVVGAVVIGFVIARIGLAVQHHVPNPAIATVISLLVPFASYLPADFVHASGLVAVVAAGITTRLSVGRRLTATQRTTENAIWHTIEFLAEGAVFLIMGWQIMGLLTHLNASQETLAMTLLVAAIAWGGALAIRGGFITGVVALADRSVARKQARRDRWHERRRSAAEHRPDIAVDEDAHLSSTAALRRPSVRQLRANQLATADAVELKHRFERLHTALRRYSADIDYLLREPLHAREGVLLTWGGLRGVVTVAGAQTLPLDLPHRSLIVLAAFAVAVFSLLLQGLTLAPVARRLDVVDHDQTPVDEPARLEADLKKAALTALSTASRPNGQPFDPVLLNRYRARLTASADDGLSVGDDDAHAQFLELRLRTIAAQRDAVLRLRSVGAYTTATLLRALNRLDADEISIQLTLAEDQ